jgi:hypothetical protein
MTDEIKNDITEAFASTLNEAKYKSINKMRVDFGIPSIHYQDPSIKQRDDLRESFGFTVGAQDEIKVDQKFASPVPKPNDEGSTEVAAGTGGYFGTYVDLEGKAKSEAQLVTKYRQMATHPECDLAVQDVINEAIIQDKEEDVVKIVTSKLQLDKSVKVKIEKEFDNILRLLNFNKKAYDIFRQWYIDGRLVYYLNIDKKNPRRGILELRNVDPRRITRMRKQLTERDPKGATIYKGFKDYYIYFQQSTTAGPHEMGGMKGITLAKDTVCYTHSGVMDHRNQFIYSYLHKAIKPLNQLRMLEDAVVIYRLARAPERRIFYIDVGNLPKAKAEQYLNDMMTKHKNKLVYNAQTGEVQDDRRFMTMLEDFWLPRRGDSGKSTQIDTLSGGQNLGEMEDIYYFEKKLYKALGVPISRLESDSSFNMGRSSEITRDEVKFNKFISRLRMRFSETFDSLLEIQLALKGIVKREEFKKMRQDISYDFYDDNFYQELKNIEIWNERFNILERAEAFAETYLSPEWINKNILQFTDKDIALRIKERDNARDEREGDSGEDPFRTPKALEMDKLDVEKDVVANTQNMSADSAPSTGGGANKITPSPTSSASPSKVSTSKVDIGQSNFSVKPDKSKNEELDLILTQSVIKFLND